MTDFLFKISELYSTIRQISHTDFAIIELLIICMELEDYAVTSQKNTSQ